MRKDKTKETIPDHLCGAILLLQLAFHSGHNSIDLKAEKEKTVVSASNQPTCGWTERIFFFK